MPKFYGLWNDLPECCQQCKNIKPGDINKDIFECSKNLILPTKKRTCGKQVKKRESIKGMFKRFLIENDAFKKWINNRSKYIENKLKNKLKNPYLVIAQSFWWEDSKEGYFYWNALTIKWQEVIRTEYPEYLPK